MNLNIHQEIEKMWYGRTWDTIQPWKENPGIRNNVDNLKIS